MKSIREIAGGAVLFAAALAVVTFPQSAASAGQSEEPVPAYHTQLPASPLPETMSPDNFDNPIVKNAYALSAKTKKILYQQPCYCHCDKGHGHGSLLDCFVSKHASVCEICIREALYSHEQSKKGKTASQIRDGIQKGEWQNVDITPYKTYTAKP